MSKCKSLLTVHISKQQQMKPVTFKQWVILKTSSSLTVPFMLMYLEGKEFLQSRPAFSFQHCPSQAS